eukprot:ANDGO_08384.mRNA.1 hypothetical protein
MSGVRKPWPRSTQRSYNSYRTPKKAPGPQHGDADNAQVMGRLDAASRQMSSQSQLQLQSLSDASVVEYGRECVAAVVDHKVRLDAGVYETVLRTHIMLLSLVSSPEAAAWLVRSMAHLSGFRECHSAVIGRLTPTIFEAVSPLAHAAQTDDAELKRLALKCLANLVVRPNAHAIGPFLPQLLDLFLSNFVSLSTQVLLFHTRQREEAEDLARLYSAAAQALAALVLESKDLHLPHVTTLISLLRPCVFLPSSSSASLSASSSSSLLLNSDGHIYSEYGSSQYYSTSSEIESDPDQQQQSTTNSRPRVASRSKFKDAPSSILSLLWQASNPAERIQLSALCLLSSLAKSNPKSLHGHWNSLFADHDALSASPKTPHLFHLVLHHPSARVRSAVCAAISSLLDRSKPYLATADDRPAKPNVRFVTSGQTLGAMLREMHGCVRYALDVKGDDSGALFRCAQTLIENCAFEKLSGAYLKDLVPLLLRSNTVDAVSALGACFATSQPLEYMRSFLTEAFVARIVALFPRTDAIVCLSKIAYGYGQRLSVYFSSLLEPSLRDVFLGGALRSTPGPASSSSSYSSYFSSTMVAAGTGTVAVGVGVGCAGGIAEDVKICCMKLLHDLTSSPDGVDIHVWEQTITNILLPGPLSLQGDYLPSLRLAACHLLCNLSAEQFPALTEPTRKEIIARLLQFSRDPHAAAQSAIAMKAMGTLLLFPPLVHDGELLESVLDIVEKLLFASKIANGAATASSASSAPPPSFVVPNSLAVRASWALANICDAIHRNPMDNPVFFKLTEKALPVALRVLKMSDKVKSNGVRALGNLASCLPEETLVLAVRDSLVAVAQDPQTTVKTKWNICYAFASLSLNPQRSTMNLAATDFLCGIMTRESNFKARIQATNALVRLLQSGVFKRSDHFAELLMLLWRALIRDVFSSEQRQVLEQSTSNLQEYRYFQVLERQLASLVLALCSMSRSSLSIPSFLQDLTSAISSNATNVYEYLFNIESRYPSLLVDKDEQLISFDDDGDDAEEENAAAEREVQSQFRKRANSSCASFSSSGLPLDKSASPQPAKTDGWEERDPSKLSLQDLVLVRQVPVAVVRAYDLFITILSNAKSAGLVSAELAGQIDNMISEIKRRLAI